MSGNGSSCGQRTIEQARLSDRPIVARRCATPSRLTAGPTIFLTEAREARRHPTSARPKASSVWRSRPRAASAVWPRRHPSRRTWPSSYKASLPTRHACALDPPSSPRPRLLQHPDDLIFREPCSLHLSVLQEGRTLNPRGGKSQWQVSCPSPDVPSTRCSARLGDDRLDRGPWISDRGRVAETGQMTQRSRPECSCLMRKNKQPASLEFAKS